MGDEEGGIWDFQKDYGRLSHGGREVWFDLTRAWQESLGRRLATKANSVENYLQETASRTDLRVSHSRLFMELFLYIQSVDRIT